MTLEYNVNHNYVSAYHIEAILLENKKLKSELEEAKNYADALVAHRDMPCLPADLANLRKANLDFAMQNHELQDALRDLACYLGVGGYNDEGLCDFDVEKYIKKIKEGIQSFIEIETKRLKRALEDAQHESRGVNALCQENATLRRMMIQAEEQRDSIDSMYHKIIKEVLKCDPISACKREEDQLEQPWEVIARIREQRDDLLRYNKAFRKEALICADCDSISKEEYDQAIEHRDRMAEAMEEALLFPNNPATPKMRQALVAVKGEK